jgi:hypothetical protein
VEIRKYYEKIRKYYENCKSAPKKKNPKQNKIICHEIEPDLSKDRAMHEGDNHSF